MRDPNWSLSDDDDESETESWEPETDDPRGIPPEPDAVATCLWRERPPDDDGNRALERRVWDSLARWLTPYLRDDDVDGNLAKAVRKYRLDHKTGRVRRART